MDPHPDWHQQPHSGAASELCWSCCPQLGSTLLPQVRGTPPL